MNLLLIIIGKIAAKTLRLSGKGGSAMPGLIVEKLNKRFLANNLNHLREGVVVITGTNGKTTTTKAVANLFESEGLRVLTNPTGSNFTRGIISTIIEHSTWTGRLEYDIAVLELDEAFSRHFTAQVQPRAVLILNVMRDQLDRYGEIDTTAQMMLDSAKRATEVVILNRDDNRVREMAAELGDKTVHYFSAHPTLKVDLPNDDDLHGNSNPTTSMIESDQLSPLVELIGYHDQTAMYKIDDQKHQAVLKVAGLHNALNFAAAMSVVKAINPALDPQTLITRLEQLQPAWGRGELIKAGNTDVRLALVKNPAGFRQVIKSYQDEHAPVAIFAINDDFADGRDVSWLWDVDFSGISKNVSLFTSGVRAYDMANRLRYDDLEVTAVAEQPAEAISQALNSKPAEMVIYCTYTAMLSIRKELGQKLGAVKS